MTIPHLIIHRLSVTGLADHLQNSSSGCGTYLLTASTGLQAAVEKEGERYGLLTKHIIHGIETGDADQDEDGLITMDELYILCAR